MFEEATEFRDLEVRAWRADPTRVQVMVHNSPAGDMRRPVDVHTDTSRLAKLSQVLDDLPQRRDQRPRHPWPRKAPVAKEQLIRAGRELASVLLPPPVFALVQQSLEKADPACLRIRLCLDGSLVDLPWEFLYRPDMPDVDELAGFLVLDPRISLVREPPTVRPLPGPPSGRGRLVFAGNPLEGRGQRQAALDEQLRGLRRSLAGLQDSLSLESSIGGADAGFESALQRPASLFHYAGPLERQGSRWYLVQDVRTRPRPGFQYRRWEHASYRRTYGTDRLYVSLVAGEDLASHLGRAGVRLATFCAPDSGQWSFVHPLLREGLPALIGTLGQPSTPSAVSFFGTVYASLAAGLSLDEAVTWARLRLLEIDLTDQEEREPGAASFGDWGRFMVYLPCADSVLLPPGEGQDSRRQADARWQRQQTIFTVRQVAGFGGRRLD